MLIVFERFGRPKPPDYLPSTFLDDIPTMPMHDIEVVFSAFNKLRNIQRQSLNLLQIIDALVNSTIVKNPKSFKRTPHVFTMREHFEFGLLQQIVTAQFERGSNWQCLRALNILYGDEERVEGA